MHKSQLPRLNKISGQINGIKKMIEENRYCMDILVQIKSVMSAMAKVRDNVLKEHLNSCVKTALSSNNERQATEKINEVINYIDKMCKE